MIQPHLDGTQGIPLADPIPRRQMADLRSRNRGTVLELLGRHDEARQHFDEATEFQP